ncbi:MAG: response regulator transcription factor [Prolixibacteraceae bacterium]
MNKLLIIIHASEIIRKGLAAIFRNFFVTEILQLENIHDLYSYREMKNNSLIIILENDVLKDDDFFKILKKNNQVNFIYFNSLDLNTHQLPNFCKEFITLNSTAFEIQEIISNCWKTNDRAPRQLENDELSAREKEVLRLVALGHSNKIIADKLFISIHTVISHRKNISEKIGIKSISGLTVYAILNNLIDTKTINPEDLI